MRGIILLFAVLLGANAQYLTQYYYQDACASDKIATSLSYYPTGRCMSSNSMMSFEVTIYNDTNAQLCQWFNNYNCNSTLLQPNCQNITNNQCNGASRYAWTSTASSMLQERNQYNVKNFPITGAACTSLAWFEPFNATSYTSYTPIDGCVPMMSFNGSVTSSQQLTASADGTTVTACHFNDAHCQTPSAPCFQINLDSCYNNNYAEPATVLMPSVIPSFAAAAEVEVHAAVAAVEHARLTSMVGAADDTTDLLVLTLYMTNDCTGPSVIEFIPRTAVCYSFLDVNYDAPNYMQAYQLLLPSSNDASVCFYNLSSSCPDAVPSAACTNYTIGQCQNKVADMGFGLPIASGMVSTATYRVMTQTQSNSSDCAAAGTVDAVGQAVLALSPPITLPIGVCINEGALGEVTSSILTDVDDTHVLSCTYLNADCTGSLVSYCSLFEAGTCYLETPPAAGTVTQSLRATWPSAGGLTRRDLAIIIGCSVAGGVVVLAIFYFLYRRNQRGVGHTNGESEYMKQEY